ncbi:MULTISPECIES: hypothetical protein [Salimicrobium]|uniref:CcoQ/FixQ family Cbb3-type cytochrome c oxidase assembly chaperone n=3 Tax=Salimicrobium TaxID=351195 RepID=K2FQK3_9BACI|nr:MULTISPECIES: hypothetical protein [Salimicrobium]AKG04030.1 hypothetical protein AAV35_003980 [Salimicrobium jeotgali]EKE33076.1 hypothetical protein MJ3_01210 [Salimicrobium jeotgali]SDY02456.1 hypothetical protein SAMN04488081_1928 [Salimicrobium album]SIS72567.1 hypothetical protein SAMN05421758_104247 [Salimicrobium salexigens]
MDFLYFPQDKTEYIPSMIMLVLFMVAAIVTVYIFVKASKREEDHVPEHLKDDPHYYEREENK